MSDVKNWVFLIILINVVLLPLMWLREDRATPQVLGASESVDKNGNVISKTPENPKNSDLGSWFNDNIWGSNTKTTVNSKVKTIGGDVVSSDLPSRPPLQSYNTTQNLDSMLSNKQNSSNIEGKVVQRDGFKNNLAIKDMELGDKVKLKCGDKEIEAVIDGAFLSFDGVLGVASQNIFSRLGVDSTQTKELSCKIVKI